MTLMNKARSAIGINLACFSIGLVLLFCHFDYMTDSQISPEQVLASLLLDVILFLSWHVIVYFVYGLSLLLLTISIFMLAVKREPEKAIAVLVVGALWSGFMLISGGVSVETIHKVAELYPHNSEAAIHLWLTMKVVLESVGGGNELIGAVWVLLVSQLFNGTNYWLKATRNAGFLIAIVGLGTLLDKSEVCTSLFGVSLLLWFVLLFKALPVAFHVPIINKGRL